MQFLPEIIAVSVVVAGLLLYIVTKILNNNSTYKLGKQELLNRYRMLRVRSLTVQDTLSSYIMSKHIENERYDNEYSYSDFLKHLQKNHIKNLSDKNYSRISATNNRIVLNNAKSMLDEQELKLEEIENKLKVLTTEHS